MKYLLDFLQFASDRQRKMVIQTLSDEQLKLLIEIIYNVSSDVIAIPKSDENLLRRYKLGIRRTLVEGISRKQRRQRLLSISQLLPIFIKSYIRWQEN